MRDGSWFVFVPDASQRMMRARWFATLALCFGCALFEPAARAATPPATAAGAATAAAAAAADDQALLEFTQAAPVTSSEHDRIAAQILDGMNKNPERIEHADEVLRDMLAKLPALKPADSETIREELRVRLAMLPQSTLEWQILEKHDPIVASARDGGQAITARTVVVIGQATQWLAKQLGVAGPGGDFVKTETAYLRDNFAHFTSDQQDACSHIARNMAASVTFYERLSPDERRARLARARSLINGSVPLDAVAVLAMARAYAQTSVENRFLAITRAMFHLQNTNQLVMGLEGLNSGQYAPHF